MLDGQITPFKGEKEKAGQDFADSRGSDGCMLGKRDDDIAMLFLALLPTFQERP